MFNSFVTELFVLRLIRLDNYLSTWTIIQWTTYESNGKEMVVKITEVQQISRTDFNYFNINSYTNCWEGHIYIYNMVYEEVI